MCIWLLKTLLQTDICLQKKDLPSKWCHQFRRHYTLFKIAWASLRAHWHTTCSFFLSYYLLHYIVVMIGKNLNFLVLLLDDLVNDANSLKRKTYPCKRTRNHDLTCPARKYNFVYPTWYSSERIPNCWRMAIDILKGSWHALSFGRRKSYLKYRIHISWQSTKRTNQ